MADTRKKYTKEFKLDAIRLLESGTKPGHEIEHDLGKHIVFQSVEHGLARISHTFN